MDEGFNSDCPLITIKPGCCNWCGKRLKGRQSRWCCTAHAREFSANHRWTQAKAKAKAAATWFQCARCEQFFRQVEVNHIVPCRGRHGKWGCWHHADNLEVLCKPCHLAVTNEQRERNWT